MIMDVNYNFNKILRQKKHTEIGLSRIYIFRTNPSVRAAINLKSSKLFVNAKKQHIALKNVDPKMNIIIYRGVKN
jgi:hypothetical protein